MSRIQKILKFILPASFFTRIEEESRTWFIECDDCKYTISYWEAGGIRASATRNKKIFGSCPHCRKFKFFKVIKKDVKFTEES
jgi:hypothetical protein